MALESNGIPIIYILLYSKLKQRSFDKDYLETSIVMKVLKRTLYCSPGRSFIYTILKEMESYGLIRRIHKFKYQILESKADNEIKNLKPDEFNRLIEQINQSGKLKCEDASIYKLIPSTCIKKLENMNVWMFEDKNSI